MIPEHTGHAQIDPHNIVPENRLRFPSVVMPTADFTAIPHFAHRGRDSGSNPLQRPPFQRIIISRDLPRLAYNSALNSELDKLLRESRSGGVTLFVFSQGEPLRVSLAAPLRGFPPLRVTRFERVSTPAAKLVITTSPLSGLQIG